MAKALNTIGYMSFLLRTKTSRFSIENTITMDELEEFTPDKVTKLEDVLEFMPRVNIKEQYTKMLHNGNKLPHYASVEPLEEDKLYLIYDEFNTLCGVGHKDEEMLRMKILLRDPNENLQ